jgi:hypothetical protein
VRPLGVTLDDVKSVLARRASKPAK